MAGVQGGYDKFDFTKPYLEGEKDSEKILEKARRIWSNCSKDVYKIFMPLLSMIKCSKLLIVIYLKKQFVRCNGKKEGFDEIALSNYFNTFFFESETDINDRMKKYIKANMLKMKKIHKISDKRFKKVYEEMNEKAVQVFKDNEDYYEATSKFQKDVLVKSEKLGLEEMRTLSREIIDAMESTSVLSVRNLYNVNSRAWPLAI